MGEGDNSLTDAKFFTVAGRYLVDNQGGCIQIQQKFDDQTGATPPLLFKKITTKR